MAPDFPTKPVCTHSLPLCGLQRVGLSARRLRASFRALLFFFFSGDLDRTDTPRIEELCFHPSPRPHGDIFAGKQTYILGKCVCPMTAGILSRYPQYLVPPLFLLFCFLPPVGFSKNGWRLVAGCLSFAISDSSPIAIPQRNVQVPLGTGDPLSSRPFKAWEGGWEKTRGPGLLLSNIQ